MKSSVVPCKWKRKRGGRTGKFTPKRTAVSHCFGRTAVRLGFVGPWSRWRLLVRTSTSRQRHTVVNRSTQPYVTWSMGHIGGRVGRTHTLTPTRRTRYHGDTMRTKLRICWFLSTVEGISRFPTTSGHPAEASGLPSNIASATRRA